MVHSRFKLPGFGLPLKYIPADENGSEIFLSALNGEVVMPLTTLREFTMLHLMNQLTDKPDWDKKVFDKDITSKWKSEALATEGLDITTKMVDWCIAELQYKANIFKETGVVSIYNGDVVKSDTAIPEGLKEKLKLAVAPLENIPARLKDWHPGSDEKVLDLVHPSLFPLVYGRTRILPDSLTSLKDCIRRCGEGTVAPVQPEKERKHLMLNGDRMNTPSSANFQWLPSDVDISGDDQSVKFTSYINNLHPHIHKDLYSIVEQVISKAIPLWNMTLTPLKAPDYKFERITYTACEYSLDPKTTEKGPERLPNEKEEDYEARGRQWFAANRVIVQPEPGEFKPPTVPDHLREEYFNKGTATLKLKKTVDLRRDCRKRGLQIIVKLANIHLTPEKPEYEGGSWHVEGQPNEHICATAIYYYDSVNITTSRFAFRQSSNGDTSGIDYKQGHHDWLEAVFGCNPMGNSVQEVGAVDTKEGRLVTFPNILHHRLQPFKLADPTKPGHRKSLVLFLVEPNIPVISTANVPCQQREWWSNAIQESKGALTNLPVELQDQVFETVEDFPIGLDEAKEMRLELMEERGEMVVCNLKISDLSEFSLCEH